MRLLGGPGASLRVDADLLREALAVLLDGARQATRLVVDGESTRKGPRPAWLDAACRLELTGLAAGSVVMELEAPSLAQAAPARFGESKQVPLFGVPSSTLDSGQSAVDIFGTLLADALGDDPGQVFADRAFLDTCVRFARLAGEGYDGVQLEGIAGHAAPILVRRDGVAKLEALRDDTPGPRATRLVGTLDTISASKPQVILLLADGTPVTARVETHDNTQLRTLYGAQVVVSGMAHFRPSGQLLTIDVTHLAPARPEDAMFDRAPVASTGSVLLVQPGDEAIGVATFFGTWPGEESDQELLDALRAVR